MDAYIGGDSMVRLERQGDSFVLITGTAQRQDTGILINALCELQKNPPDIARIKEGLLYLDNSAGIDIRKEIKTILQKAVENNSDKQTYNSQDNI
ncbi:MAG: hypothetical protein KKD69_04610 [Euryarchaeota archaeon]|nr:hypothetical protein [Euryarchaeota archaeon]MBU4491727.1 hypothetical protein [Euryarchaeota archaeon]